jgi:tRNA pseudouridine55 synthase
MPTGILLLDKPLGLSSNAALQRVRTRFAREKAGHVGSLDPLASGMLPICLGEATKIAGDIIAARKCYRFTVSLGTRTATGDAEGAVTESRAVPGLTAGAVETLLAQFRGAQTQVPPMYSALKRDGQPLYALARSGITVERAARPVEIFTLSLVTLRSTALELQALCSKGTYIRVLAEDLAAALGTCGHVSALRRLYVEPFETQPMLTLAALEAAAVLPALLPTDCPLAHLPQVQLEGEAVARLMRGQKVPAAATVACARVRLYGEGRFLGVGETSESGDVQPRRLLNYVP